MNSIPIGQAVVRRVIAKLGGVQAACARLAIEPSLVNRFLDGTMEVPDAILLRAIDVVLDKLPTLATAAQPLQRTQPYQ